MGLLYDRTEDDGVVEIVYRRYLWAFPSIFVVYMVALFVLRSPLIGLVVIVIGTVMITRDRRILHAELSPAAKEGRVTMSGSRWSLRDPLTYRITGAPPKRKGKGTPRSKKRRN